jgi:outer membrane lipoprotein carrier protein
MTHRDGARERAWAAAGVGRRPRRWPVWGAAWLALGSAIPAAAPAQTADGGAILDRAVAAYAQVTTLRADFVQTVRDPMIGIEQTSRGEFHQQRPNRFAMRWRDPGGDVILADGQYLWVYLPSTAPQQVVRQALRGDRGEGADLVAEFLERPRERFTAAFDRTETLGGRAADVLALTPRDRHAPYRRVLIWLDRQDNLPRQVEITETTGALRRVRLDRMRVNQPVAASVFTFRPPAGVRVVDATR